MGNDVSRVSTLETSIQFLRENYYSCITEHEECRSGKTFLPKRVVDISKTQFQLIEPCDGTEGLYATLSYSWGARGFAMNTSQSYDMLKHPFNKETIPKAFQEAAALAQSLNIQYLWIDTLCIVQDNIVDWEEQAAMMGKIFEGAAITIAASSSPHPSRTLFETRDPKYQEIELFNEARDGVLDVVFKARRKIVSTLR